MDFSTVRGGIQNAAAIRSSAHHGERASSMVGVVEVHSYQRKVVVVRLTLEGSLVAYHSFETAGVAYYFRLGGGA